MGNEKQTRAFSGVSWRHCSVVLVVTVLFSHLAPLPSSLEILPSKLFQLLTPVNAFAQTVDPVAKSKYEAGLRAMKSRDCNTARALFQQAIERDPRDRSERVGMYFSDYFPNAKLRELQSICASTAPPAAPPSSAPPVTPPAAPPAAPLALNMSSPQSTTSTVQNETDQIAVEGTVQGGSGGLKVTVNGRTVQVGSGGRFSVTVPLKIGTNQINVRASDSTNKGASRNLVVTRSAKEPAPAMPSPSVSPLSLAVSSPSRDKQTVPHETDSIDVRGMVEGGRGGSRVRIKGEDVRVDGSGSFHMLVPLQVGVNKIVVSAADASGSTKTRQLFVTRSPRPAPAASLVLSVTAPSESGRIVAFETDRINVAGSVKGGEGAPQVTVNNKKVGVEKGGSFATSLPLDVGENRIAVVVKDSAGTEDQREIVITRRPQMLPPPVLTVTSPSGSKQSVPFETDKIDVSGSVKGGEGATQVTVNDTEATVDGGSFTASVPLLAGENKVAVVLKDSAGREDRREFVITRRPQDLPPPVLTMTSPSEPKQSVPFETAKIDVSGSVKGGAGAPQITVNDTKVTTDGRGSFVAPVPLDAGENKVTVVVKDSAGNEDRREFLITRRPQVFPPPVLTVTSPSEPKQSVPFETDKIDVAGTVKGGEGAPQVTVNNTKGTIDTEGSFTVTVPLEAGENKVTLVVKDSAGREDRRELVITRRPQVFPPPVLTVTSPPEPKQSVPFQTDKIDVVGAVTGGKGPPQVTVNNTKVSIRSDGSFSVTIPLQVGENKLTMKVEDAEGREAMRDFLISRNEAPPPVLRVSTPTELDEAGKVTLQGTVSGGAGELKLSVDGQKVPIGEAGAFSTRIALKSGKNKILLQVEDSAGKRASQVWFLFNYGTSGK